MKTNPRRPRRIKLRMRTAEDDARAQAAFDEASKLTTSRWVERALGWVEEGASPVFTLTHLRHILRHILTLPSLAPEDRERLTVAITKLQPTPPV